MWVVTKEILLKEILLRDMCHYEVRLGLKSVHVTASKSSLAFAWLFKPGRDLKNA